MNNNLKNFRQQSGFTLLEVVIGSAIITSSLLGVLYSFPRLISLSRGNVHSTKAAFLLEEGMEVVRIWRDISWSNLSGLTVDNDYYYQWTGNAWATTTTNTFVDDLYERKFQVSDVNRDSNGAITDSGGTNSQETKLVTVTVSWSPNGSLGTTTRSVSAYFTNLFN